MRPLSGVTVLAIEQLMALPFGTQVLADLGAEVIAVSPVGQEAGEAIPWRERTGRHKQQISIDFKHPEGQALLRALAKQADVVAENFRPGVMDRYGLGYAQLSQDDPRLIYASVSGYGHRDFLPSPNSDLPAYGPIGEAMSGVLYALRRLGAASSSGIAFGDIVTSIYAVIGILAALRHRDLTGCGQYVDLAMADSLLALGELGFIRHSLQTSDGISPLTKGPKYPVGVFPAADGEYSLVILTKPQWLAMCALLDRPQWTSGDSAFAPDVAAQFMEEEVLPYIRTWGSAHTKREAADMCRAAGIPAAPVNAPADVMASPHYEARDMVQTIVRPGGRPLRVVGNPIKLSADRPLGQDPVRLAGAGEHTREILAARLGLSQQEIDHLLRRGLIAEARGSGDC